MYIWKAKIGESIWYYLKHEAIMLVANLCKGIMVVIVVVLDSLASLGVHAWSALESSLHEWFIIVIIYLLSSHAKTCIGFPPARSVAHSVSTSNRYSLSSFQCNFSSVLFFCFPQEDLRFTGRRRYLLV